MLCFGIATEWNNDYNTTQRNGHDRRFTGMREGARGRWRGGEPPPTLPRLTLALFHLIGIQDVEG
jgi:hypothetical protein